MGIFDQIDFNHFPQNFKEDSVREEIVTPLLKCLGYSAFDGAYRIIRSPRLEHPFIRQGTKSHKITVIPDYLIQVNGTNAFIMDAKSPGENIVSGKHVEQAYSYAIHPQIQVDLFVLCNGKEISVFHVKKQEPVLHLFFTQITQNESAAGRLFECLSPQAFMNPHLFDYKPDYGMWCIKNGIGLDVLQSFHDCYITEVARLDDRTFTFMAVIGRDEEYLASFDFDLLLFEDFMSQVPDDLKEEVWNNVRKSPFKYIAENKEKSFALNFTACLSDRIVKNANEVYLPLVVKEFISFGQL